MSSDITLLTKNAQRAGFICDHVRRAKQAIKALALLKPGDPEEVRAFCQNHLDVALTHAGNLAATQRHDLSRRAAKVDSPELALEGQPEVIPPMQTVDQLTSQTRYALAIRAGLPGGSSARHSLVKLGMPQIADLLCPISRVPREYAHAANAITSA